MTKQTYNKPSDVVACKGAVLMDGPDGIDLALTPEAAQETGVRLIDQAAVAVVQREQAERDEEREERRA